MNKKLLLFLALFTSITLLPSFEFDSDDDSIEFTPDSASGGSLGEYFNEDENGDDGAPSWIPEYLNEQRHTNELTTVAPLYMHQAASNRATVQLSPLEQAARNFAEATASGQAASSLNGLLESLRNPTDTASQSSASGQATGSPSLDDWDEVFKDDLTLPSHANVASQSSASGQATGSPSLDDWDELFEDDLTLPSHANVASQSSASGQATGSPSLDDWDEVFEDDLTLPSHANVASQSSASGQAKRKARPSPKGDGQSSQGSTLAKNHNKRFCPQRTGTPAEQARAILAAEAAEKARADAAVELWDNVKFGIRPKTSMKTLVSEHSHTPIRGSHLLYLVITCATRLQIFTPEEAGGYIKDIIKEQGFDINTPHKTCGSTALTMGVDKAPLIRRLLKLKANPDIDAKGKYPLTLAIEKKKTGSLKLLIQATDPNIARGTIEGFRAINHTAKVQTSLNYIDKSYRWDEATNRYEETYEQEKEEAARKKAKAKAKAKARVKARAKAKRTTTYE